MAAPRIDNQDLVVAAVHNVASPTVVDGQAISLQADASGNLLVNVAAGGSGGVQYADGVTQVTPTGTVALGKNPSNILHALGLSAAGNLNVNLAEGTISGGNAAASATGAAVPASADYQGVNIGGNLVGVTGLALGGTTKATTVAIVDGAGNQITTFGGGTQFADNAASGGTPTGTLSMGWDSVNSKIRALKVDATQNLLVDVSNASISVTQGTSPWVVSLASTTITGTVAVTQSTSPWVVAGGLTNNNAAPGANNAGVLFALANAANPTWTEGDLVLASVDLSGNQRVKVNAPLPTGTNVIGHIITDSGSTTVVTGTVAVTQSTSPWVTSDNHFPSSVALADNLANPTTTEIGANLLGWDATNTVWRRVQVDAATGTLKVDGSGSTQPVSGTVTANQGTNPWTIQGDSASGAAKAGNPTQIGGVFNTAQPTVTTGQTVEVQATARGALIVATGVDPFAVTLASTTITGTVAVTQSTSPWVVSLASTTITGTVSTKTPLTPASPTFTTTGVASATAVAANANRKGLVLINTSSNNISLGFGVAAVLNSGVTLSPFGVYVMDEFDFSTGSITAIASAASSNLAIQEFST